jgi:Na+/melibiose symporter-like transporter
VFDGLGTIGSVTNFSDTATVDCPQTNAGHPVDRWAWLRAGIAVATVGWGANQFAPLLLVYRSQLGLSAATVNATFGLYALGLIPALLVCGPLSDRFGRRRIMVPALLASGVATVLLIAGGSALWLLFVGRLVAGLAGGAAFSSGAAWIKELSAAPRTGSSSSGPRRVTVSMTAGFGGGPLVAGLLAQWAPSPTVAPYLPHLALLVVAMVLMLRTPETRTADQGVALAEQLRMTELRGPRFRGVVMPLAPWVFGSASIALAYLPGLIEHRLGHAALAFTAVVTMLTALAGIVVQPLARRIDVPGSARLIGVSLTLVLAGVLVAAVAASTESPLALVVAILVLGAGYGACQVCGLQEIQRLAKPESLAGLTAVYQAVSYLGFAMPFLLAAAAPIAPAGVLLLVVAGLAAATLTWTVRRAAATPAQPAKGTHR